MSKISYTRIYRKQHIFENFMYLNEIVLRLIYRIIRGPNYNYTFKFVKYYNMFLYNPKGAYPLLKKMWF